MGLGSIGETVLHRLPDNRETLKLTAVLGFNTAIESMQKRHADPKLFHKYAQRQDIKALDLRVRIRYGSEEVAEVMRERLGEVWSGWVFAEQSGDGVQALISKEAEEPLWKEMEEKARKEAIRTRRKDEERRARAAAIKREFAKPEGDLPIRAGRRW